MIPRAKLYLSIVTPKPIRKLNKGPAKPFRHIHFLLNQYLVQYRRCYYQKSALSFQEKSQLVQEINQLVLIKILDCLQSTISTPKTFKKAYIDMRIMLLSITFFVSMDTR